jgi:hypothetical protein
MSARLNRHPNDERDQQRGPHPPRRSERLVAGHEDEQAAANQRHERGRHRGPPLGLVGKSHREERQQRPTEGEPKQHGAGDHVFLRAGRGEGEEHDGRNKPADQASGDNRPYSK